MFEFADLEEKYVLCVGKSFGLRASDFLRLSRGDLEPYVDREPPAAIGQYATQKEDAPAYPFIDSDSQPVIKLMLDKMTRQGRTKPSDRMLSYRNEIQLSRTLRRLTEKAGIVTGNKIVRFHCLRKFLIDHLSSYMSESKWKMVVGKKVAESAYVSSDTLRDDYKRVMSETTFKNTTEIEERLKSLEEFRKSLTPEQLEKAKRLDLLRQKGTKKPIRKEKCEDGEHCGEEFEQISESKLLDYLREGWTIVKELANRQLIVRK